MEYNQGTGRERQITRVSVTGIVTNVLLAAFKALVGLLAHSVAVVLDAVNNLSDALSSVITIVGIRLARRKPDKDHPFGHGRIEYFSAIVIALIVFAAGVTSFIESAKKMFAPEMPDYSTATLVVIAVAIVTKLLLGRYVKKQGEQLRSDALEASGADASFDAILSAATLVSALVALIWNVSIDAYIGALISVFIVKAGVEMLGRPLTEVLGARPVSETTRNIKADIRAVPGVLGAYDLILHNYGPEYAIGSVHVEVDNRLSAREVNAITKEVQRTVARKYSLFLTVGIYAVDVEDDEMDREIRRLALSHEGFLQIHGLFVDHVHHYISFDVVTDFKVPDRQALRRQLTDELAAAFPDYTAEINLDIDYSD